jgi:methionyl-tRNA formyltransferase
MKKFEDLRIVFFGTPDFAVASLDGLVKSGAHVVAVVTAPDKPSGRGMQLHQSAVKEYAVNNGLAVLQPEKMKAPDFLEALSSLRADLQVVVAFRMMPVVVWDMPPMGTINVHGSLLPQYRGAAPINWAIINGERETGVTTFKLKHEIDTGDILLQQVVPILPADNAGTMHDKLMIAGASLLVKTVKGLAEGSLQEQPQTTPAGTTIKHAPKIFKENLLIDWAQPARDINNFIKGMSPHPGAYTVINNKNLKIFSARTEMATTDREPGVMETDHNSYLRFAAADGWVYAEDLQLEGKKRMGVADFLRGFRG